MIKEFFVKFSFVVLYCLIWYNNTGSRKVRTLTGISWFDWNTEIKRESRWVYTLRKCKSSFYNNSDNWKHRGRGIKGVLGLYQRRISCSGCFIKKLNSLEFDLILWIQTRSQKIKQEQSFFVFQNSNKRYQKEFVENFNNKNNTRK